MNQWLQVAGRFHLILLHLPIGLLTALALVETATLFRRYAAWNGVAKFIAAISALSAVVAAVTGFLLHYEGGFDEDLVFNHKVLGIALAVMACITAMLYHARSARPRRISLLLTLLIMIPAGHFGGTMTHGENFLFAPLTSDPTPPPPAPLPRNPADAPTVAVALDPEVYQRTIAPILETNCVSCHGSAKHKGDLALHTLDAIFKGGGGGPVVASGDPAASELMIRLELPLDDEDHMPPESKQQLTPAQIDAIRAWIAGGTPAPRSEPAPAAPATPAAAPPPTSGASAGDAIAPVPAPAEAISLLHEHLINVEPVAQDSTQLVVSLAAIAASTTDLQVGRLLTPLQPQIADLSLARSQITDEALKVVAPMRGLRRLDLRATAITTEGIALLKDLPQLHDLILSQTKLADPAADLLISMPQLKRVYLWKSGLSDAAIARLRDQRPDLLVDAGDRSETIALDTETELKFSGDAPPIDPPPAEAAAASLAPINTTCPVSGDAISAKYQIVYKGRVVAFCCPNCPQKFWTDPGQFESKLPPAK